jgi:hypothetical protein
MTMYIQCINVFSKRLDSTSPCRLSCHFFIVLLCVHTTQTLKAPIQMG